MAERGNTAVLDEAFGSLEDLQYDGEQIEYDTVHVPGGKSYRIGSLTAQEWTEYVDFRNAGEQNRKLSAAFLIAKSLVDRDNRRIGDMSLASLQKLAGMKTKTSEHLVRGIFRLNGIGERSELSIKNV